MLVGDKLIGESQGILGIDAAHEGGCRTLNAIGGSIGCTAAIMGIGIVERKEMLVAKMIGQVGNGSQGVALEFGKRRNSLALIGVHLILTRPAIGAAERIHIIGLHHVVTCRQSEVQTWDSKISLLIEQRGSPSLRSAILAAKHDFHQVGVLYLCIFMAIVQAENELVGPFLIYHTQLEDDSLVVVSVVKAAEPRLVVAYRIGLKISPLRLYLIVVV